MRRVPRCLAFALGLMVPSAASGDAVAFERQWHVGLDGVYSVADWPEGGAVGLGGGTHLGYGLTDAINVRVHLDVSSYPSVLFGGEERRAMIWNSQLGAEYVIDVFSWIPYLGLTAGPTDVLVQGEEHNVHLGLEVPLGLGYRITPNFAALVEGRLRMLMFGRDPSPGNSMVTSLKVQYLWEH
jgi:hypothetical protein